MKLLHEFPDDIHPFQGIEAERHAARAFVLDGEDRIGLLRIHGLTESGAKLDCYLTPGGAIEADESPETAAVREVREELGYDCEVLSPVGVVVDYYNDMKQKNIVYYFIVRATRKIPMERTPEEQQCIKGVEWMSLNEGVVLLETYQAKGKGPIFQRRDLCAMKEARDLMHQKGLFRTRALP